MTDNVKHSTSYFHEVLAKAFEMFKNGYEPVMETPFQPRRQGSAFVVDYKLVREPLDQLAEQAQELDMGYNKQLTIDEKWEIDDNLEHDAIGEATGAEPYIDPLDIEGGEKELAEREDCGRMVYTKQELDAMHWDELKPLLDEAGIKGRRRQNLIRDFLKKQEEEK